MHCVDLGESFPTSIHLQNVASIKPRTSSPKFAEASKRYPPPVVNLALGHLPLPVRLALGISRIPRRSEPSLVRPSLLTPRLTLVLRFFMFFHVFSNFSSNFWLIFGKR